MFGKKNKEVGKMIVYKIKTCGTHVDNYLFLTSAGFNLSNSKMALTLEMPLERKGTAENFDLLRNQLIFTVNFLYRISSLREIVRVTLLDENNLCLVKDSYFDWLALERKITQMIKDSYQDRRIVCYRGHENAFGKAEEDMASALEECYLRRISKLKPEETLLIAHSLDF